MKKVVFLDWYNTLSRSLFWEDLAQKKPKYYQKIVENLFYDQALVEQWMKGDVNAEIICKLLSKNKFFSYDFIFQELIKSSQHMSFVSPEIPSLIKQLKDSGSRVVIATDNMDTFRRYTIKSLNLDSLFDDFLISYELKTLKYEVIEGKLPFFHEYLEKNNLSYEDVVLLDDSVDVTGKVEKIGLSVTQIKSTNHLIKELKKLLLP